MGLRKLFGPASILTLIVTEVVLIFACFIVGAMLVVHSDVVVFLLYHSGLIRISILVAAIVTRSSSRCALVSGYRFYCRPY